MKPCHRFSIFFALVLVLGACSKPGSDPAKAEASLPVRAVSVATVEAGTIYDTVEVIGELEGGREARVLPTIPERIQKIHVREGQKVKRGQLLATLRGDLQQDAARQAQAMLLAAEANYKAVADNLARTRKLVEGGAASQAQLDTAVSQHEASEAQVRQARAAASQASTQSGRMSITSPIDGVVTHITAKEGDFAAPSMPMMTVVSKGHLRAVFNVPERFFGRMKKGMAVEVQPLSNPEASVRAEINELSPAIDRMTRTGLVEVLIDNKDAVLIPGSAVRAVIVVNQRENALLVPAESVLYRAETERTGKADVFVAVGKTAEHREVVVGGRQGERIEITSGLASGEPIVTKGAHLLRDKNPIDIVGHAAKQ
jgi:RND family efflux transporter MFP subunit